MAELAGLLLAGGRSSRFGSDKALAVVAGERLLDRAEACLRDVCDGPVVVASGDGRSRPHVGDRQVADRVAGAGPLSAVAAGLVALRREVDAVAVLAVDHLAPSPALLRLLAGQPGDWSCALAVAGGRWQPLHAVWSTAASAEVAGAVDAGERSVVRWLTGRPDVLIVPEQQLRVAGIAPSVTADVDAPGDLPSTSDGAAT